MFRRQMNRYFCFSTVLSCVNLALLLFGRLVANEGGILECTADGTEWISLTRGGEVFITAHIIQIIVQAIMVEKVLYRIPNEYGWFDSHSKYAELGSSDEE